MVSDGVVMEVGSLDTQLGDDGAMEDKGEHSQEVEADDGCYSSQDSLDKEHSPMLFHRHLASLDVDSGTVVVLRCWYNDRRLEGMIMSASVCLEKRDKQVTHPYLNSEDTTIRVMEEERM